MCCTHIQTHTQTHPQIVIVIFKWRAKHFLSVKFTFLRPSSMYKWHKKRKGKKVGRRKLNTLVGSYLLRSLLYKLHIILQNWVKIRLLLSFFDWHRLVKVFRLSIRMNRWTNGWQTRLVHLLDWFCFRIKLPCKLHFLIDIPTARTKKNSEHLNQKEKG